MTNEGAIEILKERITDNQDKTIQIFLEQDIEAIEAVLNLLEKKDIDIIEAKEANRQLSTELQKKDEQLKELKEIDEKRTWTVNKVISEYIPDYELISLVDRYKDESFVPRVEVEKMLKDRKK